MRIPRSIEVYGQRISVRKVSKAVGEFNPKDHDGFFDKEKSIIYLSAKDKNTEATFLHELIHAVCHRVGVTQAIDDSVEEVIAESISVAVAELFDLRFKKK